MLAFPTENVAPDPITGERTDRYYQMFEYNNIVTVFITHTHTHTHCILF